MAEKAKIYLEIYPAPGSERQLIGRYWLGQIEAAEKRIEAAEQNCERLARTALILLSATWFYFGLHEGFELVRDYQAAAGSFSFSEFFNPSPEPHEPGTDGRAAAIPQNPSSSQQPATLSAVRSDT